MCPLEFDLFSEQVIDGASNVRESSNESSVVGCKTHKGSGFSDAGGYWICCYCFDLCRISVCSFMIDDVSEVCNFFFSKFAFLGLDVEAMFAEPSEDFLDMFQVFLGCPTEDDHIIHIYHHPFLHNISEDAIHHSLKTCWCIAHSKGHAEVDISSIRSDKG